MLQHLSDPLHLFGVVLEAEAKLDLSARLIAPDDVFPVSDLNHLSLQRRSNHLAGQMAAKTLLQKVYALPFHAITIHYYPSGAPYAEAQGTCYDISISHIAAHGAAALSLAQDKSIGIDLVRRRAMALDGLIEKTLDAVEQQLITDHLTDFFSLWALKEAALKTWQVGMRVAIWDVHVRIAGTKFHIEAPGFSSLCGTTLDLNSQIVLGVVWGQAPLEARWQPRGLHMGC